MIEEIEGLARSERLELENRLIVLIMHLLKWAYQPGYEGRKSWEFTIREQRNSIEKLLKDMPSPRPKLQVNAWEAHKVAILRAAKETGTAESVFPEKLPYTTDQLLDDGFWPA